MNFDKKFHMSGFLSKLFFPLFLSFLSIHTCMSDTTITYDNLVYGKTNEATTSYLIKPTEKTITSAKIREMALGCNVTSIRSSAFRLCESLKEVTFPSELTTIGSMVFQGCIRLRSIDLPKKVEKIDSYAFSGCI